jgi:protocatechuate 3,4-dioxygenase beta subunit
MKKISQKVTPLLPTPSQDEGPFYPPTLPPDQDNDLTRMGDGPVAKGVITCISGRVLDPSGHPVQKAVIEIWQCDYQGFYYHPRNMKRRDPTYQGFGTTITDADGRYYFRTIRPVPYDNRAPHIHFKVRGTAFDELTTQMYVAGEPRNDRDFVLNKLQRTDERARLIIPLKPDPKEVGAFAGSFNIVLGF